MKAKKVPIPANRPQMKRIDLVAQINEKYPQYVLPDFLIVGIRGYYKKTLGDPTKNDRMIYDDAIFILHRNGLESFNANVDPGAFREGIANLVPGIYPVYKFSKHNGQYLALCQRAGNVTVQRDQKGLDTGRFGINIHKGGIYAVSSLGCQTIPRSQWDKFISDAQHLAQQYHGKDFLKETYTYILLQND